MGPVIGFLIAMVASSAIFGAVLWRRYKRLEAQIATGEKILERALAKAQGRHLWRVKALAPVAAGVELARRHSWPSVAALGAATVTGVAVLLIPVDGREMDAELAPMHPSGPVVVEPARTEDSPDAELESGSDPAIEPEPEPEVAMSAAPADEPAETDAEMPPGPPEPDAATPTTAAATTTTVATVAATTTTTTPATVVTVPDLPELPTPTPKPRPRPEPRSEPEPRGCVIGLGAELAGVRVSVCV